jgi:putative PEP-CTERM system TPR-repeat lipoprotein
LRAGDRDRALEQARRFAADHPQDAVAQSLLGGLALDADDRVLARSSFEKALQLSPTSAPAVLNLGWLDLLERKLASAEQRFKLALELEPGRPEPKVAMAHLSIARGDSPEAIRWLEAVRLEHPRAIEPRVLLGQYYLAQRRFAEAQAIALEANRLAPEDPAALNILGLALTASGQSAAGISALEGLSARNPQSAQYQLSLARAYLAAGRTDDALASLRQAVKLDEGYLPAHALLAGIHLERGAARDANEELGRLKRLDAKNAMTRLVEGDIAMSERRYADAAAAYNAAGKQTPNSALVVREFLARNNGKLAEPLQPLEEWLVGHPTDSTVRMILAQALHESGRIDKAQRQYELIVAQDPKHAAALNNLAWLQLSAGDTRTAVGTAERAYRLQPRLADVIDTYGWALFKNGEGSRAEDLLREAHDLAPRSGEIRFHLAAVLADGGELDEARGHLRVLAESSEAFPSRSEAAKLLARLSEAG